MTTNINPGEIVQLCYAFVGAKAALSAVELELFTELAYCRQPSAGEPCTAGVESDPCSVGGQ